MSASPKTATAPMVKKDGVLLLTLLHDSMIAKLTTDRRVAVGIKQTEGSTAILENLSNIGTLIVHKRNREKQWIFPVKSIKVEMPSNLDNLILRYPSDCFLYVSLELGDLDGELYTLLDCTKAKPKYDAMYSTIEELS